MRKELTAAALVATLALAGYNGDADRVDVGGTSEPTQEAPTANLGIEVTTEEPIDGVTQDQEVLHGEREAFVHPGMDIGEHGGEVADVGKPVIIPDGHMGMSWADITLEGMSRSEVDIDGDMHHVSIMAFATQNNSDAGEPVELLFPVDCGGFYYVAPDGTATMLYNQAQVTFALDYAGYEVARWHRGPTVWATVRWITRESLTAPDGDDFVSLQYRNADGYVIAE